jgi:glycosyltransferase involved in cell wall biosynthesis
MVGCPEFYLLVAGSGLSSRERTAADYRELATRLGVSERCRWDIRRIPEQEVGNLVEASDLVLLTYSASFRSASGVLNVAACFRRPCLASGGESNLRTVVQRYNLGYWVEPDSATEIAAGLRRWLRDKPVPRWDSYAEENSWSQNASLVVEGMFGNARVAVPQRILATQHA